MTSISVKSNIQKETTDILILTSPYFQPLLHHALKDFQLPIYYYTSSSKYEYNNTYDTILRLDTAVLVQSDINVLFTMEISPDKIYATGKSLLFKNSQEFVCIAMHSCCKIEKPVYTLLSAYSETEKILHQFSDIESMTDFWQKMNAIPKIFFQTDKKPLDTYVTDMIRKQLGPEWRYEFYNDDDILAFFRKNPIQEFPDIISKYNSLTRGAHRADLFRYYYLYVNGGVFMDSDAMIYANIDTIVKNYNFFSVLSSCVPCSIFQGVLGGSPKNEIIKRALYNAYITDTNIIHKDYHYWCKQLYNILANNTFGYSSILYTEKSYKYIGDSILNTDNIVLFKHYWCSKLIPMDANDPRSHSLVNHTYSWGKKSITFLENGLMNAFGTGMYVQSDTYIFYANFGSRMHTLQFNADYTEFTSTRMGDGEIIKGSKV